MGAFDDLLPNQKSPFDDLIPEKNNSGVLSSIKKYGLSALSGLASGTTGIEAGLGTFLQAPAANTLSGVVNTGAALDRALVDLSNYAGKDNPEYTPIKYHDDIQQSARLASAYAQEQRDENAKSNVAARAAKYLEGDARSRSGSIDQFNQQFNPELVSQQKEISDSSGLIDKSKALVTNPLAAINSLSESAVGIVGGLGASRLAALRALKAGDVAAETAALRVAAQGGDVAAQQAASNAALATARDSAVKSATRSGIATEASVSGLNSRESAYTDTINTTYEELQKSSKRFNELVSETGSRELARQRLANEVADSTPLLSAGLTAAGTVLTNRAFGGDATAKALSGVEKPSIGAVAKDIVQEGTEEVAQGVPQEYSDYRAKLLADNNKQFDLGGTIAENAFGGLALGGLGHTTTFAKERLLSKSTPAQIQSAYEENAQEIPSVKATDQALEQQDEVAVPNTESQNANANDNSVNLTQAEKALTIPSIGTNLDRVYKIDAELKRLSPENGYGQAFDAERADLISERQKITSEFPQVSQGIDTTFSTEDGARINGKYALISANDLVTSHDESLNRNIDYPQELQPRDRSRAASATQIAKIVQNIDPARLGTSFDAANGAPIIGDDGIVESGNARSIAIKRIYQANGQKAEDYKSYLRTAANQFGIDPLQVDAINNPVLVRIRTTPVNRQEFARQANAPTVAQLSVNEQARVDSARINNIDDLVPNDNGDFTSSKSFITRFINSLPETERSTVVDSTGSLSAPGYARIRNAILSKAYGDSPVVTRLTESLDNNLRNVSNALIKVAPDVAKVRSAIETGDLHNADITPDLLSAVEQLSKIKEEGNTVKNYLSQQGLIEDNFTQEQKDLLQFLDDNIRKPNNIADFILEYNKALRDQGNPKQGDIFDANREVSKQQLISTVNGDENGQSATSQTSGGSEVSQSEIPSGQDGVERADQGSDQESNPSDQTPARGEGQGVVVDGATDNLDSSKNIGSDAIIGSDNGDQSGSFSSVDLRKKNVSPSENFSKNVPASNSVEEGNGEVKDQTETKNFKKWFSGSKVVDDNGNPLPMYHGTNKNQDGDAFKIFDAYGSNYGLFGNGQYFTDDPYVASSYTDKGKGSSPSVYKVFLSIKNPINMDVEADPNLWKDNFKDVNFDEFEPRSNTNESYYRAVEDYLTSEQIPLHDGAEIIQDGLRSMGYDGIQHIGGGRVKSEGIKHKVFIAFDPEQIKSATGNNGNFDTNNPDIRFKTIDENRNYLIGISTDSLREKVKSITDQWKNSPKANIVETPSDLPFAAPNDARGAYYNGEIYLVASNIHSEHDAEIVLFHESLGHAGLRGAFGNQLVPSLRKLAIDNLSIAKAASEWRKNNENLKGNRTNDEFLTTSVEEVLSDIVESGKPIKGFDQFISKVQSAIRSIGLDSVADWIGRHTNADVTRLLTEARKYIVDGNTSHVLSSQVAQSLDSQQNQVSTNEQYDRDALFSLADKDLTPQQRAEKIINQKVKVYKPIDRVFKAIADVTQLNKVTRAAYRGGAFLLDRYTPEYVKAGLVSNYGNPQDVQDRRASISGHVNVQTRKVGQFIGDLSTLTREESRVANELLTNSNEQAVKFFESQLPKESVQVINRVKKAIDELSKRAVDLGLLDEGTYKKNRFEYARRSYEKYVFADKKESNKFGKGGGLKIKGDNYKGRGISESVNMKKLQSAAPEWWGRKLKEGIADTGLINQEFVRLENRDSPDSLNIPGIDDTNYPGKLKEVIYYPAKEKLPEKYKKFDYAGTYKVINTKANDVILHRDFSKQEREQLGEIDDVRYNIAATLHTLVNDVETASYFDWVSRKYGIVNESDVPGDIVDAKDLSFSTLGTVYKKGDYVLVPDTKVQGTDVTKYGNLAGKYIPAPIFNDIRSVASSPKFLPEVLSEIQKLWKISKTALSPSVHTSNIVSNFVMADWHDVSSGHVYKALRIILSSNEKDGKGLLGSVKNAATNIGISDKEAAKEILNRYQDSGGNIGTYASIELQNEQLKPLLDEIEKELYGNGDSDNLAVGVYSALQYLKSGELSNAYKAAIASKPVTSVSQEAKNLINLYQSEDDVFRLAAWLRAKENGATDQDAGKDARKSFLDYNINAPWIAAMRATAFPFVSFSYRAIPLLADTALNKPWKIFKLGAVIGGLNALGYLLSGGNEDDERKYLPEEKAGRIFGVVPKLVRLPWNDDNKNPVFLDIRRFIPVGDVFDVNQGHSVLPIPPSLMPGGPLVVLSEGILNKSSFTGKEITKSTDTLLEKLLKTGDYTYKALAPNIPLLPGTYSFDAIKNASKGKTDAFGRELSLSQALFSSAGIKVGTYAQDTLRFNAARKLQSDLSDIDKNINDLKKEYSRKGITYEEFKNKVQAQQNKKIDIVNEFREK